MTGRHAPRLIALESSPAANQEPRCEAWTTLVLGCVSLYAVLILYVTLTPFDFVFTSMRALQILDVVEHTEFSEHWGPDFLGNVLLFFPLGLGARVAAPHSRIWISIIKVTLIAGLLSASVEAIQVFSTTRQPGIPDVLANAMGAALGAWTATVLERNGVVLRLDRSLRQPFALVSLGSSILVLTHGLLPFDISLHSHVLARSVRTLQLNPMDDPGTWFAEPSQVLLHALTTGLFYRWMLSYGTRFTAVLTSLAAAVALAVAVEALQLLLKSRTTATNDLLSCMLGGLASVILVSEIGKRAATAARISSTAFNGALFSWILAVPLTLHAQSDLMKIRLVESIPLYWVYFGRNLHSSVEFLGFLLVYIPVGYMAAAIWNRSPAIQAAILICVIVPGVACAALEVHAVDAQHQVHWEAIVAALLGSGVGIRAQRVHAILAGQSPGSDLISKPLEGTRLAIP